MRDSHKPTSFHQLTSQHQAFLISGQVFSRTFCQVQITVLIWDLSGKRECDRVPLPLYRHAIAQKSGAF
ncbi:MAG: hypothetical protein WA883_17195 [Phormidesmis sp.]